MNYERIKRMTAALLCGSFAVGAAAGAAAAGAAGGESRAVLGMAVAQYAEKVSVNTVRAWAGCLAPVTAAIAAGMTVYCRAVYPLIFFVRGLASAYAVSAVYAALGRGTGFAAALAIFAPKNALLLAGLLILCMDAYAKTLAGLRCPEGEQFYVPDASFLKRTAVCLLLAAGAALCVIYVSPWLAAAILC